MDEPRLADDRRPHDPGRPVGSRDAEGLRVLLVLHQFFPFGRFGTERYALELAHGLRELGHRPSVLTVRPPGDPGAEGAALSRYTWEGIPVWGIDGALARASRFVESFTRPDLRGLWQEVLWNVQPDVLHACHLLHHTPELLVLAHETGVPQVLTLTDFWGICWGGVLLRDANGRSCPGPNRLATNCVAHWAETHGPTTSPAINAAVGAFRGTALHGALANAPRLLPGPLRRRLGPEVDGVARRGRHIRERYELADAWIAPSQYLLDQHVRSGYSCERFRRIPYGIEGPSDDERETLARRFARDRPEDAPLRLGYLGQVAPHKGVHHLVEAFRAAGLGAATLDVHGYTDLFPDYLERLRGLVRGDSRIALRGAYASRDVYRILAGIDVLVIPSLWHENAPLVLLSALASGTPVVVPDAAGMVEFVRPDREALVYPMGDADALAACLARLEHEPGLLRRMAAELKPYAFSPLDCAWATLDVYEAVGAGCRRARYERPPDRIEPSVHALSEEDVPSRWRPGVLGHLALAQGRDLEIWVPRAAIEDPSSGSGSRNAGWRRSVRNALRRLGSLRGGLRVAYHSRPCFSLWSFRRPGRLDFTRHPDFAQASQVEIVARHNRGSRSRLRYRVAGEDAWRDFWITWPKGAWARLRVPLVTVSGRRLAALQWEPTVPDGRVPLKLDLLDVALR